MALVVNTNVLSMKVNNNLNRASDKAATAMERMSTGYKINSAADDAAGFMIAKGLETQISGSSIAASNAQNGISILQTAEGVLDVIQDNLLRMRDLTLQAMNGGYSETEIDALEAEAKARALEIDRLAKGAKFNNFKIFKEGKEATTDETKLTLQVGVGAEAATNTIKVENVFYGATLSSLNTSLDAANFEFDTSTRSSMETLLTNIDSAVTNVSQRRSTIGVSINRLNSAIDAMQVQEENLSSSRSRIMDADIAEVSSEYTKQYILQQASASLLTQANQTPSLALSLI